MKHIIALLLTLSLFSFYGIAVDKAPNCNHNDNTFNCVQYVSNYDGDTITVNIPDVHPFIGRKISVRVFGIDTPEIKTTNKCEKDKAIKARDLIKSILKPAKRIDLQNIQRDKYFRILATVVADGKILKDELIKAKLAYEYFGETKLKMDWCK